MTGRAPVRAAVAVVALAFAATAPAAQAQSCPRDTVTAPALADAMQTALRSSRVPYDIGTTTNSTRFETSYLGVLAERALARHPDGGVLVIPYDLLWQEYLRAASLAPGDSSRAPVGRLLGYQFHQGVDVVFGPVRSVVRSVEEGGREPLIAANVRYAWPDRPDGRRKFSYADTLSVPKLQATQHQVMTFRLLIFDDMVAVEQIHGISGRPLTGFLAAMFKLLGEGNADFARIAISSDGQQVVRTRATKLFSKTVTGVVAPDGHAGRLPKDRPDLAAIEARLDRPLRLEYEPYRCWAPGR